MKEIAKPVVAASRVWKNSEEARAFAKSLAAPEGYEWQVAVAECEEWFERPVAWKLALVNLEVERANEENVAYGGYAKWNAVARWF